MPHGLSRALLACTLAVAAPATAYATGPQLTLLDAFAWHSQLSVWPLPLSARGDASSTFGPRIRASNGDYDWHRGFDVHGEIGDPVLAVHDATLVGVRDYTGGGQTVILRHDFAIPVLWEGRVLEHWYTLYMHLDAIDPMLVEASDYEKEPLVAAGQQIGTVGMTGNISSPHLHMEVRVGTRCSLEFQLENPTSSCAEDFFYDPHVHPLVTQPPGPEDREVTVVAEPGPGHDGRLMLSTRDVQPAIVRYDVAIGSARGVRQRHVLDLTNREGFDPTSEDAMDTPDTTRPYLAPADFGHFDDRWTMELVVPAAWVGSKATGERFRVSLTDIWGRTTVHVFGDPATSW